MEDRIEISSECLPPYWFPDVEVVIEGNVVKALEAIKDFTAFASAHKFHIESMRPVTRLGGGMEGGIEMTFEESLDWCFEHNATILPRLHHYADTSYKAWYVYISESNMKRGFTLQEAVTNLIESMESVDETASKKPDSGQ